MHNSWRLLNDNSMKTKERSDYNCKSWLSVFHKVYLCELDSSLVSQSLGPRSLVLFVFGHEVFAWSVPYSRRNKIANIRWSVPCCFAVFPLIISDVFFVLLTIGSLAADEPFPNVFMPTFTTWFENLGVLGTITFLPGQDLLSVLFKIFLWWAFLQTAILSFPGRLIRVTRPIQCITLSPSATSSSSSSFSMVCLTGISVLPLPIRPPRQNPCHLWSSSIKRRRVFMTLRCIASCLIWWVHFRRSK